MSERKEYRVYAVAIDMSKATEGDYDDFRRALDALECDYAGVHLLGTNTTRGWPTFTVREAAPTENA